MGHLNLAPSRTSGNAPRPASGRRAVQVQGLRGSTPRWFTTLVAVEEINPLTAGGLGPRGPLDNSFTVVCIGPLWPINAPWPLTTARGRLLIRLPCWNGKMRIGSPSTTRTALRRTRCAAGAASPSLSATTGGVGRNQPLRRRPSASTAAPRSSTRVSISTWPLSVFTLLRILPFHYLSRSPFVHLEYCAPQK